MGRRLRATSEKLRHTASRNVNEEIEDKRTRVQKAADWIAEFSGSIPSSDPHRGLHGLDRPEPGSIPGVPVFDPVPVRPLTMFVSLEAIFLSVFVLLSQNRQAAKDRIRSDVEYEVNLKAELEMAHLHEVDHLGGRRQRRLAAMSSVRRPSRSSDRRAARAARDVRAVTFSRGGPRTKPTTMEPERMAARSRMPHSLP